jgi:arylsulfatase A-like enzyme
MDADREGEYETLLSVDDAVKSIMDELQARGVLDNTVVIYLSDNGFSFGEHRWETKTCPYGECTAVPFFVRYPSAVAGTDRQHLVSTVDLAPTIAEVAGVTSTSAIDGHSLVNLVLRNPTPWRRGLLLRWFGQPMGSDPEERQADDPSDVTPYWGVRTGDYLYVEYDTGEKELYDLAGRIGTKDPYANDNHADDPAYAGVQAQLAALLTKLKAG